MATSACELDRSLFTPSLYAKIHETWFAHQPPGSTLPTEASNQLWMGGLDKSAASAFDARCESLFGKPLQSLSPAAFSLAPVPSTWAEETSHMSALAEPFLSDIAASASNALALVILLDQIPRNIFRDNQSLVYAHYDRIARAVARSCLGRPRTQRPDLSRGLESNLARRQWFLLPLMHSEHLEDHALFDTELATMQANPEINVNGDSGQVLATMADFEERHVRILREFGRYPYRNTALGRKDTDEEEKWLAGGGERFTA